MKEWINDWVNLFPADVKWNGVHIRSNVDECAKKMEKFIKENPHFKKEDIFRGTQKYLDEREQDNWSYTKRATYFINKLKEPSLLLDYTTEAYNKRTGLNKTTDNLEDIWIQNFHKDFI